MFRQKTWNSHYKFAMYSIKGGRLVYGYGKWKPVGGFERIYIDIAAKLMPGTKKKYTKKSRYTRFFIHLNRVDFSILSLSR